MSLFKFFGEQGEGHGGRLFWSVALGGLPFRGPQAPLLTRDEVEQLVEIHHDYHVQEFDLRDEEQRRHYIRVMERVVNGWYVLHKSMEPSPMTRILEWTQRYGELAPGAKAAAAAAGGQYGIPR